MANLALMTLHYLSPVAVIVYFLSAKAIAACYLHTASKSAKASKARRYIALAGTFLVVATFVAQGIGYIAQAANHSVHSPPQDAIVYVLLAIFIYSILALSILDSSTLLWHPHLGAWMLAFATELPILVLQSRAESTSNDYAALRLALHTIRVVCLTLLSLSGIVYSIRDVLRSTEPSEETESLLGNGHVDSAANGDVHDGATAGPYGSITPKKPVSESDSEDDDEGFDSESEEPEEDKAVRAEQKRRLQAAGNYFDYVKDFKIFIPILWPKHNRMVQVCMALVGMVLLVERALNVLVPLQLGNITEELAKYRGTGIMPWRTVGLWMLYYWLNSPAGLLLIKSFAELPIQQFAFKAIGTTAFQHVMGLSMDFHSNKNSGELIRAIEQGQQLQSTLEFMCFEILPTFIDLGIALVYVYSAFDIYLTLILLGVGTLYVWIGAKTTILSIKQRRRLNTAWRNESRIQNEAINNWQTVSYFNRGQYECDIYSVSIDELNSAEWWYYIAFYLGGAAQSVLLILGRLGAHALAAYRVVQGKSTVGQFVTLTAYWGSLETPLIQLSWSVRRVSSMLTDSERLLQLLKTKPSVVERPDATDLTVTSGEVVFDHVSFAYDERKPTLKDVSFTARPGETIALVGETGGGKSTVLKLLYRYYDINEGSIRIDGQDIRSVTLDSLRDAFGMVPQDPALFNDTIMKNMRYARLNATDDEVKEACRAAQIHDKILTFPDGYNSKVGERGVKLSGGELQRVAIARALLCQPKIVLLDEATSAIDTETESHIQKALKELTKGRTTFVIAHRLSTIQHADTILVIQDGQIVEHGSHDELFRTGGKYVQLWSKQLSKVVQEVGNSLARAQQEENEPGNVPHES